MCTAVVYSQEVADLIHYVYDSSLKHLRVTGRQSKKVMLGSVIGL